MTLSAQNAFFRCFDEMFSLFLCIPDWKIHFSALHLLFPLQHPDRRSLECLRAWSMTFSLIFSVISPVIATGIVNMEVIHMLMILSFNTNCRHQHFQVNVREPSQTCYGSNRIMIPALPHLKSEPPALSCSVVESPVLLLSG